MTRTYRLVAAAALAVGLSTPATAAPIGFTFNAGPVIDISTFFVDEEVSVFQDLILGEDILVTFTIDSLTPDLDGAEQRGEFEDPSGTITLTGATSGTVIEMEPGVNIQLDSEMEFDLRNIADAPPAEGAFQLVDDIDFETDTAFLSDPDDLSTSIAELQALLIGRTFGGTNTALSSTAAVVFVDSITFPGFADPAFEFGPVPTVVPLPASLPLLALGVLAAGVIGRRRATAKAQG